MNTAEIQDVFQMINSLNMQGLSTEAILEELKAKGLTADIAQQHFSEWKKIRNEKKRNSAFIYCGIGIFLLTTGFFFTLLLFNSNSNFNFALYGLTIIGLILVFKGMIDLMS